MRVPDGMLKAAVSQALVSGKVMNRKQWRGLFSGPDPVGVRLTREILEAALEWESGERTIYCGTFIRKEDGEVVEGPMVKYEPTPAPAPVDAGHAEAGKRVTGTLALRCLRGLQNGIEIAT